MSVVLLKHHYDAKDFFLIYMFTMPKRSATVYLGLEDFLKGGGGQGGACFESQLFHGAYAVKG